MKETIGDVKEFTNPSLEVEGLLLVKFGGRMRTEKAVLEALGVYAERLNTKIYETKIRNTNTVQKAQLARTGLYVYDPTCTAALDYLDFTKEVILDGKAESK